MSKLVDKTAIFFSNDHRYIKQDGSGFYSGRLRGVFERAAFNAGALVAIGLAAYNAFSNGDLSTWKGPFFESLFDGMGSLVAFSLFDATLYYKENNRRVLKSQAGRAIDTLGNSFSRANLTFFEVEKLKYNIVVQPLAGLIALGALEGVTRLMGGSFLALDMAPVISAYIAGDSFSNAYRSYKLYRGHTEQDNGYVFCDVPPKEEVKKAVFDINIGGVRTPSI